MELSQENHVNGMDAMIVSLSDVINSIARLHNSRENFEECLVFTANPVTVATYGMLDYIFPWHRATLSIALRLFMWGRE